MNMGGFLAGTLPLTTDFLSSLVDFCKQNLLVIKEILVILILVEILLKLHVINCYRQGIHDVTVLCHYEHIFFFDVLLLIYPVLNH